MPFNEAGRILYIFSKFFLSLELKNFKISIP